MLHHKKQDTLLSISDVCERLGVTRQTVYTLRVEGKINSRIVSKTLVRFTEEDVTNYINAASKQACQQ